MNEPVNKETTDLVFHAMLWVRTRELARVNQHSALHHMLASYRAQYYCVLFSWMMDNKRRINHG
jgi:hypothetical protein